MMKFLLLMCIVVFCACENTTSTSTPTSIPTSIPTSTPTSIPTSIPTSTPTSSPEFSNPQLVSITGYTGDIMEPFISRDGLFLFFNDNVIASPEKDIHYARSSTNPLIFTYVGKLATSNSNKVDGAPSMDENNTFYFVSLKEYDATTSFTTIHKGVWDSTNENLTNLSGVSEISTTTAMLFAYDIEVNKAGTLMFPSLGFFEIGKSYPSASDILYFTKNGSTWAYTESESQTIMASINDPSDLEYAACISNNGLEIFFTRASSNFSQIGIYTSTRETTVSPFGPPTQISSITGFIEGPALSVDEKKLYYHRHNETSKKYELWMVTRP